MIRAAGRSARRSLAVVEIVVLAGLNVERAVRLVIQGPQQAGVYLYFAVGLTIGVLALARRRYPGRLAGLAVTAIALSLAASAIGYFAHLPASIDGDAETLALAILIGASCHHLRDRYAVAVAVLGGLVVVAAPVLRYGYNAATLAVAVFWALLWGASVGVGLILRDGDARREAALAAARNRERLALARELHDLVAHHITGVVVRTQAAQLVAPDQELLGEIEQAGAEALGAVRRLVTMLRSPDQQLTVSPGNLVETIYAAVGEHDGAELQLGPELTEVGVTPETVSTVHRVLLESLTNVRKHAPDARRVTVDVAANDGSLRVVVQNDGVRGQRAAGGYGLIGMAERIDALEGTLVAGRHGAHDWRVVADLPLAGGGAS